MSLGDSSPSPARSPTLLFPAWQREYEAVWAEIDAIALFKRVEVAEAAILTRRTDLDGRPDHERERAALDEALANLQFVKRDWLKFG